MCIIEFDQIIEPSVEVCNWLCVCSWLCVLHAAGNMYAAGYVYAAGDVHVTIVMWRYVTHVICMLQVMCVFCEHK